MTIQDAYNQWAVTYDTDRNLTRDLDKTAARQTLAGRRFRRILEAGCGTGKNTPWLAEAGEMVFAIDFSAGMIAQARAKAHRENVVFALADITCSWPFAAGAFDLVTCNLILEHIEDLTFVFSQAQRCLVNGGLFFICELHPYRQYQGTKARFERGPEMTHIEAYTHHISDFLGAAPGQRLRLVQLKEWWHAEDEGKPPRLISFLFENTP